MAKSKSN